MLKIKNLEVGYSWKAILKIEDLDIGDWEIISLIGKSGCWKSTLFQTLNWNLEKISWDFFINSNSKNNISLTLQWFPLLNWLTVKENLELVAKIKWVKNINFNKILEEFEAEYLSNIYPNQLSWWEQCRASLCQAMLTKPNLLLLDEPFTGLDTVTKRNICKKLFSFTKKNKTSVIIITHDIYDAIEYSEKIIVFWKNKKNITEIKKRYSGLNLSEKKFNLQKNFNKIVSTLEKEYN